MERYGKDELVALLPYPAVNANKYSRGKLVLFAGSERYPGAAILAAEASQRTGAGYTEVITAPSVVSLVQMSRPSLVARSWEDVLDGNLAAMRPGRPVAYVVGPGLSDDKKSAASVSYFVLGKAKAPVLVDGGALSLVASKGGRALCKNRFVEGHATIVTPHWGEAVQMAKVFDLSTEEPAHLAYSLSLAYGAITVLKGPQTFISDGEEIFAVSSGTPALAKAGTGDVLSGIIGALLAQGVRPLDASVLGVTLHAKAGCLAADALTTISVTAEDVIANIPLAIRVIEKTPHETALEAPAEKPAEAKRSLA